MKTLRFLPLAFLMLAMACTKENIVPESAPGPGSRATARLSGDTLIRISGRPDEKGPMPNWKVPTIRR